MVAGAALDPAAQSRAAAARAAARQHTAARRRRPRAADALRETRAGGWFRAAPGHPWLDPAVTGDPGHVPARVAVAVDGKERKLAKAGGKKKVHLLGAVTHVTGLVIGQDKVAKSGKANEVTHFKPLLEPLPLRGAVVTADAMQATRDNARYAREVKHAHFLWPVLGNQPGMYAALDALDWRTPPSPPPPARSPAAASRPAPSASCPSRTAWTSVRGAGHPHRAVRHGQEERPLGDAQLRGCPVRHQPGRRSQHAAGPARPRPRALDRGAPALATRRDMEEDKSLIRTGNRPQVMSAIVNLVITLFRIRGVTRYAEETRRNAQDPRRALQMLDLLAPSPG